MIEPFEISNPTLAGAVIAFTATTAWVTTKISASSAKKLAESTAAELTAHRIYAAEKYALIETVDAKFTALDSKIDKRMDGIEGKIDRLIEKFVNPASRHE